VQCDQGSWRISSALPPLRPVDYDVFRVPRHLGTDLDEFLPQRRQRPMPHWFRQSQPPQKVAQVVRQGKQLQPRLIVFERAAGELRPFDGVLRVLIQVGHDKPDAGELLIGATGIPLEMLVEQY